MTTLQYLEKKNFKIDSDDVHVKQYSIKVKSKNAIVPILYNRTPSVVRRISAEQAEKVSFSNRVDEDLTAEYKGVDIRPTDKFFETWGGDSREETKHSLKRKSNYDYRKTSRENNQTDTSLYDIHQTRGNISYISDPEANFNDNYRSDTSLIIPNTTDSLEHSSKMFTNGVIEKRVLSK